MTHDHVLGVGALVHDVDLGDYSDGPDTLGVKFPGKLKAVTCCHICIGWDDDEDDGRAAGHRPSLVARIHISNDVGPSRP